MHVGGEAGSHPYRRFRDGVVGHDHGGSVEGQKRKLWFTKGPGRIECLRVNDSGCRDGLVMEATKTESPEGGGSHDWLRGI